MRSILITVIGLTTGAGVSSEGAPAKFLFSIAALSGLLLILYTIDKGLRELGTVIRNSKSS